MANYSENSFIQRNGLIDNTFLDINKLPKVPKSIYDEDFTITQEFHNRPDLLSYKLYETSRLWWVFALRNLDTLKDPIRDFKAGTNIKLPAPQSVKNLYSG
jgi:hypothetical protein|tara:strand:+ start:147 stop:449 length:303 start_codon:yes stop_codon:yes gene_type:complete